MAVSDLNSDQLALLDNTAFPPIPLFDQGSEKNHIDSATV